MKQIFQLFGVHRTEAEQRKLIPRMVKQGTGKKKKSQRCSGGHKSLTCGQAAEGAVLEPRRQEHKQKTHR